MADEFLAPTDREASNKPERPTDQASGRPRLTRQRHLFPRSVYAFNEEQYQAARQRLSEQMFEIKDDLLYACITYGDGLSAEGHCHRLRGFTHCKGIAYALLAFFVQRALGFYRLPYCADRIYAEALPDITSQEYGELLAELTPSRVDAICAEVRCLYEHTQQQLARKDVTSVVLRRCVYDGKGQFGQHIGYAELLFKLASACKLAGRAHLQFDMDVLNSYGDDGAYGHFPVAIVHEIPARDVLYCSNLVRSRETDAFGEPGMAVEDGEWVVINRSPTGIVNLPASAIQLNSDKWEDGLALRATSREKAQEFIDRFEPIVLRSQRSYRFAPGFSGGFLQMKWTARLTAAVHLLRTGRLPR
jgi:hypothetical protein